MTVRIDLYRRLSVATLLVMLFLPSLSAANSIKGRISDEFGPVKGATVLIYKSYEDLIADRPFSRSARSDLNGVYELDVPEGEYYFTSKAGKEGRTYYSYHGNNPIHINTENQWISLVLNEAKRPVYRQGTLSLTGLVTHKGQPVKKAWLSFYTVDRKSFKGSGDFSRQAEDDGTFSIVWLPPGNYVLVARKTGGNNKMGPLQKGDLFCYYSGNPIEIKQGKTLQVELPCYARGVGNTFPETTAIGTGGNELSGKPVEKREFGIKGNVTDREGKPVAHIFVVAFKSEKDETSMPGAGGRADYVGMTDKDGNYFIPVDSDEKFRIVAKDSLGGNPAGNSAYGIYGGPPGRIIPFKRGQIIDGINIVISRTAGTKAQK